MARSGITGVLVDGGVVEVEKPWWQRWADRGGVGSFARVHLVVLPHGTDADLVHVAGLGDLTALDLTGSSVTDAGLVHLGGSANLVALELGGTAVSDAGLANLKELSRLESLNLRKTRVTNSGMVALLCHASINWLDLSGTDVGDGGLACPDRTIPPPHTRTRENASHRCWTGGTSEELLEILTYLFLIDTRDGRRPDCARWRGMTPARRRLRESHRRDRRRRWPTCSRSCQSFQIRPLSDQSWKSPTGTPRQIRIWANGAIQIR